MPMCRSIPQYSDMRTGGFLGGIHKLLRLQPGALRRSKAPRHSTRQKKPLLEIGGHRPPHFPCRDSSGCRRGKQSILRQPAGHNAADCFSRFGQRAKCESPLDNPQSDCLSTKTKWQRGQGCAINRRPTKSPAKGNDSRTSAKRNRKLKDCIPMINNGLQQN